MSGGKIAIAVVWALCIVAFFLPGDMRAASTGQTVFWVMLVAHAVECAVFRATLRDAPGGFAQNALQTLAFGLFHLREIRTAGGTAPAD